MPYITRESLATALERLKGTADHLLKIWFTLKQMGMTPERAVRVTTSSPDEALRRLFDYHHPEGELYVPFAHTKRFLTMRSDAGRSIVQTTIRRWQESKSVVTVDPTAYLAIREREEGVLEVAPGRVYPQGLGYGKDGFALEEGGRVMIPLTSFAVWYYRQYEIPDDADIVESLRASLRRDLSLSPAEERLIFVTDAPPWSPQRQEQPLSDRAVYETVQSALNAGSAKKDTVVQPYEDYSAEVRSMVTIPDGPQWLNRDPETQLRELVDAGAKAILLYGPPRTGKTRAVDRLISPNSEERETIQIHDGWGYNELILSLRPRADGRWDYEKGPLLEAIEGEVRYVVLEEINRTEFTQSIGEVFSLIEEVYRGEEHKIRLRDGSEFFIPAETVIICTMNTLDRTTEEIDDALFGRMSGVEFLSRVESLQEMLRTRNVDDETARGLRELFSTIQQYYPLGHGYFAAFTEETDPIRYYLTRIRPVLQKHLQDYRDQALRAIDEKVDQLFGRQ